MNLQRSHHLSSRAWIMQERMLRILDFGKNGMLWTCRRGFASETRPQGWADSFFGYFIRGYLWPFARGAGIGLGYFSIIGY